jgi:hypothetical protein
MTCSTEGVSRYIRVAGSGAGQGCVSSQAWVVDSTCWLGLPSVRVAALDLSDPLTNGQSTAKLSRGLGHWGLRPPHHGPSTQATCCHGCRMHVPAWRLPHLIILCSSKSTPFQFLYFKSTHQFALGCAHGSGWVSLQVLSSSPAGVDLRQKNRHFGGVKALLMQKTQDLALISLQARMCQRIPQHLPTLPERQHLTIPRQIPSL